MSHEFLAELKRRGPKPRRELSTNFTATTLAKALATSPAQPTWFARLTKGLPMRQAILKPAPLLLALGVMLTVSTAAYAAFNWQHIQVWFTGSSHNKTFNAEELGFSYKACDALGGNTHVRYGVAQAAHVSPNEISALITARCEVAQAKQLFDAQADWRTKTTYVPGIPAPVSDYQMATSIMTVDRIQGDQLYTAMSVQDPHGKPLNQHNKETLAKDVRVYEKGKQVALGQIAPGDAVVKVQYFYEVPEPGGSHNVIQEKVVGLIKVNARPVDAAMYSKVFEIAPCKGNPDASCVDTPSQALMGQSFNANEGEGGNFHHRTDISRASDASNEYKAQGRVIAVDSNGLTIQAFESTKQFRISIPASDRQKPIELGDAIAVMYLQKTTEDHHVINAGDIENSVIIMTDEHTKF